MTDFCGIIGDADNGLEPLIESTPSSVTKERTIYRENGIAVYQSTHPQFQETQPATTADGSLIWVHGTPYGFDGAGGYEPRTDFSLTNAEYCTSLFDKHGIDFISGLHGDFSGLIVDRRNREVNLFTDRIGSRPLFYTETENSLVFSSRIQAIGLHPDITPEFDRGYLSEFFSVQKVFGRATPLVDVRKIGPASMLITNLDGSVRNEQTYWQPAYRPRGRSPQALAKEIVETLKAVLKERLRENLEYGVLLSGGSDSRLILGAMTELGYRPTAFHMTNWMSREARIAKRVAIEADVEFQILPRDADYHDQLLESVPQFSNFIGAFDESIASGFAKELGSVDVVITGYLGDTMFGEYPLFLPIAARLIHPGFENNVKSVSEYVKAYLNRYPHPAETPDFLDAPDVADIMVQNINPRNGRFDHHGVEYETLRELQLCEYYPLTNQFASANTDSIRRVTGHWSPFFDKRFIDLSLSIPVRDRIRYDLINLAANRLSPSLAAITHASTGIPLGASINTGSTYYLRKGINMLKHRLTSEEPPEPFLDHGPWMNEAELIRNRDFLGDAIDRNRDTISSLNFLDRSGVDEYYQNHLNGANNWRSLYTLITLLETPVAKRIAAKP